MLVALVPLFFATNVVIGRFIAGDVAPWTLAFLRWLGAFLIVLPFAAGGLRRSFGDLLAQAPVIAALGFLGMFICGGIVYLGLHYTTATNATLIYACSPVMILILEWLFRGRPIGLQEISGAALAFTGVAVVALGAAGASRFVLNPGDAMIGAGALSWSIYSVVQKRPGITAIPGLTLFAAIALMGAVLLAPMMLFEVARGPSLPQTATAWLAIVAIAFFPSVGAFFGYQYRHPPLRPGDDRNRALHADTIRRRARATPARRVLPPLSSGRLHTDPARRHPRDRALPFAARRLGFLGAGRFACAARCAAA